MTMPKHKHTKLSAEYCKQCGDNMLLNMQAMDDDGYCAPRVYCPVCDTTCESCNDSGEEYVDDSGDDSPRPWAGWLPCRECRRKEHNREWDNRFVCQYEGHSE